MCKNYWTKIVLKNTIIYIILSLLYKISIAITVFSWVLCRVLRNWLEQLKKNNEFNQVLYITISYTKNTISWSSLMKLFIKIYNFRKLHDAESCIKEIQQSCTWTARQELVLRKALGANKATLHWILLNCLCRFLIYIK